MELARSKKEVELSRILILLQIVSYFTVLIVVLNSKVDNTTLQQASLETR